MDKETLRTYLSSQYQGYRSFVDNIIKPMFGEDDFTDNAHAELLEKKPELRKVADTVGITSVKNLGEVSLDIDMNLIVYDVTVNDHVRLERNRVSIQALVQKVMALYDCAFMIFHYDDGRRWDWRFTFCYKSDKKEEATDTKRYTFLLGDGQSCRTAADNFGKLMDKQGAIGLKDLIGAFDVEALSDEFFKGYKAHYLHFVDYVTSGQDAAMYDAFGRNDKRVRDYVKKLLGRIVFLHFLQKKGWLGVPRDGEWGDGDPQFMKHLYEHASDEQKENFLDEVLEPLFDKGLDAPRTGSLFDTHVALNGGPVVKIPYLNGGLFVRDELDEIPTKFPKEFFGDLLEFFYQYNFTIDENDPNEAEVGVDPEMLGRIFENLLEDNKDKGAFYTPKEIVQYMCRESLASYLLTDVDDEAQQGAVAQFIKTKEVAVLGDHKAEVDEKLRDVKILDPAIGSGAFPMGLLREIYGCRSAIEDAEEPAELKRQIIQHNIYGVDIEKGAVDIARLRFWLSLVVDEQTPETLPNLDYKIMQGNTLLEQYQGVDLSTLTKEKGGKDDTLQWTLYDDMVDVYRKDLTKLLDDYYDCSDHVRKAEIREKIAENVKKQLSEQAITINFGDIDIAENAEFFLWHTWFNDVFREGGFDIVIGNPPYVNIQFIPERDRLIYKENYTCFEKRADLFSVFLEKALVSLSKDEGVVTMIMPSVIHSNLSYKKIRNLFLNNNWLQEVCYTGGDVFHAPTVDTTILTFDKKGCDSIVLKRALDFKHPTISKVKAGFFAKFDNIISINDDTTNSLMDKLFNPEFHLLSDNYDVFQGIVTGNNPAFIFDSEQEALSHGIEKELLHPLCHGRDIEKYAVRSRERRILYINNDINIDEYSGAKEWLLNFKEQLDKRNEGKRDIISWSSLHRPRVKSDLDLTEKILVQNTRNEALKTRVVATIDDQSVYGSQGINFIIPLNEQCNLHYLLGILNSKLINYLFATKFLNLAIKAEYLKQIHIPSASADEEQNIVSLVDAILSAKRSDPAADTSAEERAIDQLVYQLYGLTADEIAMVEQGTRTS